MPENKKKMDNMTKGFLIFISLAFISLTLTIILGGHSYELKGSNSSQKQQQEQQNKQNSSGSANPEFQPYLTEMHKQISGKWQPPSVDKDSEVVVKFTILKNGHIINEEISKSSGIKELDESALTALRRSSPLPPLPLSFSGNEISINFNFSVKANK